MLTGNLRMSEGGGSLLFLTAVVHKAEAPKHLSFNSTNGSHVVITLSLTVFLFNAKNNSFFIFFKTKQFTSLKNKFSSVRIHSLQFGSVELFFGQEFGNISSYAPSGIPTEHTTSSLSVKA
ncbi:transmembrane protein, putative [Medicago truncatula]|uniref:Transmembrane protein, putative n=1 Tax=Medicago truncatula TaxID=3880 RepID=G7J4T8_MEDTR|nr:transmembrane protein, putative [Medicago truncatula]